MDVGTITVVKAMLWLLFVMLPAFWQMSMPRSALRQYMARSRYAFLSGRSPERWEFPARAVCVLELGGMVVLVSALFVWVIFLPPYSLRLTPDEHRAAAAALVWTTTGILGFFTWVALFYLRVEFTREGIRAPSPRRFLRGTLPWREHADCRFDASTRILTISTPSETVYLSLDGAASMCEAARHFGGHAHPIAIAMQGIAAEHQRPRR